MDGNPMLTDTQCRNAPPKPKPYKLTDEKGLYLEIKPNRGKVWRYRFALTTGGTRKEGVFTIGEYTPPPKSETEQQATERRAGGRFTRSPRGTQQGAGTGEAGGKPGSKPTD
jgi:Arm DNA-binding domain